MCDVCEELRHILNICFITSITHLRTLPSFPDLHLHCPAQVGGGGWTVEVGVFVISPHLPLGLDSGGGGLEKKVGCEGV